jgi:hypothetical protein
VSHAAVIGWQRGLGLTLSWPWGKGPPDDEDGPSWSYGRDFLPILQKTHGFWKLRNALRLMGTLTSPMEQSPVPRDVGE